MQVTVDVPLVADTVTTSPVTAPGMEISGVVSFVMLSEVERPVSDEGRRSGAGRDGEVVAIVIGSDGDGVEIFPSASVSVAEVSHVPSLSVGRVQLLTDPTV